jgi:hypothetical protein
MSSQARGLMTVEQAWEKLSRDLQKWTPEQKAKMAEHLRACFGVSKEQLRAMRPCNDLKH